MRMVKLSESAKQLFLSSTKAIAIALALTSYASADVTAKLSHRETINPFLAWNDVKFKTNNYKLHWGFSIQENTKNSILLSEIYWNYAYNHSRYPGIEKFLTTKKWDHAAEYGRTLATRIDDPDFILFIAEVAKRHVSGYKNDGIMLDWWHDDHPSGYRQSKIAEVRSSLVKSIRKEIGADKIILGNVNWRMDESTVQDINGVFLELNKKESNRVYNKRELIKIEQILEYYNKKLAYPKIIALEGWRKTTSKTTSSDVSERNSSENRQMAKLLTAMSVVVPDNGYILYGDNNQDTVSSDHGHIYYDFYSFDIGHPTSSFIKIKSGLGYKEHQEGFIAYNITNQKQSFTRSNGESVEIEAKSGLFCKNAGTSLDCLSYD
jgi:hypothetical protein